MPVDTSLKPLEESVYLLHLDKAIKAEDPYRAYKAAIKFASVARRRLTSAQCLKASKELILEAEEL